MSRRSRLAVIGAAAALAAVPALAADLAPAFDAFHSFDATNNGIQHGKLTLGSDGLLYGTERLTAGDAIFRIETDGSVTVVHMFDPATEGALQLGALLAAPDGWLYGSSEQAGPGNGGTLWRVATDGSFEVLHSFVITVDGTASPSSALALGPDGAFYGTAYGNGTSYAAVYRMAADGTVTIVHGFTELDTGLQPNGVTFGADGLMYGTTYYGGRGRLGLLYSLGLDGTYTIVHSFDCAADGCRPQGGLLAGANGRFFGTTTYDGAGGGGTVFSFSPPHGYRVLASFVPPGPFWPGNELTQDRHGVLYGVTQDGGAVPGWGTVFRLDPAGTQGVQVLHAFTDGADGGAPSTAPVIAPDGSLIGMSDFGGSNTGGTIYRISVGR